MSVHQSINHCVLDFISNLALLMEVKTNKQYKGKPRKQYYEKNLSIFVVIIIHDLLIKELGS